MSPRPRRLVRLLALLLAAAGCESGAWTRSTLEERHPQLRAVGRHRLEEMHPYVLPYQRRVLLFSCRWSGEEPLGVWIAPGARADEAELIRLALRAWEREALGVRFVPAPTSEAAQITVTVEDGAVDNAAGAGAGLAEVDCAVDLGSAPGADLARPLVAELRTARIQLARQLPDLLGRLRPVSREELLGGALHELAHALGFQGHATRGRTAAALAPEENRRLGRRVLRGERIDDATLRALYALPSGTLLAAAPAASIRTRLVDRMAELARAGSLEGPFAQVGDQVARIAWRDRELGEYGLQVVNLEAVWRDPSRAVVAAEPRVRDLLLGGPRPESPARP